MSERALGITDEVDAPVAEADAEVEVEETADDSEKAGSKA
jgi:large subunit ribosomal protein L29